LSSRARYIVAAATSLVFACLDYASLNPCFDGPCDGTASDAGASDAGAAATGVRCADEVDALFCEDFDEPGGFRFRNQNDEGEAGTARSDAAWTSPPSSLRAYANTTPTVRERSYLAQPFESVVNPSRVTLAFDVKVEQLGATRAYVAQLQLKDPAPNTPLYTIQVLVASDGSVTLAEDIQRVDAGTGELAGSVTCSGMVLTAGEWHHASLTMDVSKGVETLELRPGTSPCTRSLSFASMRSQAGFLAVNVGLPFVDAQPTSTWIVYEDSVVVTLP
jgi:hypothetical protein